MGQNHQSHLCCCLNNTSPRLSFTSTSAAASGCSMPRPEELVPVSPCSCPPREPQLFHSQVNFTSKNVLASALFTFTRKSLRCCLPPTRVGLPLWYGSLLWRSHPALASLILPSGATHPAVQDVVLLVVQYQLRYCRKVQHILLEQGRTLIFPILFVAQFPAQLSPSLPPGATLLK